MKLHLMVLRQQREFSFIDHLMNIHSVLDCICQAGELSRPVIPWSIHDPPSILLYKHSHFLAVSGFDSGQLKFAGFDLLNTPLIIKILS